MSGETQRRATAAFLSPIDQSVRASSLVVQLGSGTVPPNAIPVPSQDPPPETLPRQVSIPAAARPGAKTVGTFVMDWLAGMLVVNMALLPVLVALALPPLAVALPPPMARAVDWLADLAVLELTPTPTAVWALAPPAAINAMAVVASSLFMKSPMDG